MKIFFKPFLTWSLLLFALVYLSRCEDEETKPKLTGESKTYDMSPVSDPAISGTVTFAERDDDQVLITIQLSGTQSGASYPAHIHANSAAQGGGIVLDLSPVEGGSGKSETVVSALNDGTALTYEDLLAFDGYVNVHLSESDLGTLIAQGDIGGNELTGDEKVYTLTPVANPDVSGTATFAKRADGSTLITVALDGTEAGATYPSHIHTTTVAEGGAIVIHLNSVDGTTGMAKTSIDTLDNGDPITYEELLDFNGYLNVHTGSTFVVQGDIGQNELTGENTVYNLTEVAGSGVTGTATFAERKNGKTQVTLSLTGASTDVAHPAHIHSGSVATGGGIVIDLEAVSAESGKSVTSVNALNDDTPISYDELIGYNGHVNVHASATNLGTVITTGDIGANAP